MKRAATPPTPSQQKTHIRAGSLCVLQNMDGSNRSPLEKINFFVKDEPLQRQRVQDFLSIVTLEDVNEGIISCLVSLRDGTVFQHAINSKLLRVIG